MTVKVEHKYVHRRTGGTVFVWDLLTRHDICVVRFEYLDGKSEGEFGRMNKSEFQATFREKG